MFWDRDLKPSLNMRIVRVGNCIEYYYSSEDFDKSLLTAKSSLLHILDESLVETTICQDFSVLRLVQLVNRHGMIGPVPGLAVL